MRRKVTFILLIVYLTGMLPVVTFMYDSQLGKHQIEQRTFNMVKVDILGHVKTETPTITFHILCCISEYRKPKMPTHKSGRIVNNPIDIFSPPPDYKG